MILANVLVSLSLSFFIHEMGMIVLIITIMSLK